ncbi:putative naringenin-chalcone synthase [Larkinella arboricola]|uniref:Putative naringenin-chalcone synthase n=1 Tax=Larkinella arboricola TaxID=643671 RepID=A0A327WXF3_LARAB|nr:type III polyketide synthase [Larkinella arboricola]RAJ97476.1 putative naringenin-chalcone synthase [Larkinella arboricola]
MDSYITAIGTAVPRYGFSQSQIASFMAEALQFDERNRRKLQTLYRLTRIDRRHSVLPDYGTSPGEYTFFPNTSDLEPFPTVGRRMEIYRKEALPLALAAIENLHQNGKTVQPTHLITVSCTGMYAPGLDIDLIEALNLPTTLHRTAINFMGCYGAFNALKTADAFVRADPSACVLVVCLELCTLHFQKKTDEDQLLSNALFADGAAAVLVEAQPNLNQPAPSFRMRTFFCDLWPDGKEDMGWIINDHGFEMTLTSAVPTVIQHGIGKALSRLLEHGGLAIEDITHYAMHPGGRKILEVIEQQLGIDSHENRFAYEVLRQYGNMSSATVLFVLKAIQKQLRSTPETGNILSCAFGPGLTLESMILEIIPATHPVQTTEVTDQIAANPAFIP